MKLLLVVLLTALGAALVLGSGFLGGWDDGAISSIALEVGAALLLVPVLFWGERQLEARIESVREQVREDVRGLRKPRGPIRLTDPWEDAHAYLERYWHLRNETTVDIRLGSQEAWLCFATMRQFNPQRQQLFAPIYIYFHDPASTTSSTFEALYEWASGVTLGSALSAAYDTARRHNACPAGLTIDRDQVVADLRQAVDV
jgi:hypothetical protein